MPIFPPIPRNPLVPAEERSRRGWQAEPNFRQVAEWVDEHCDCLYSSRALGGMFDRRFLLIPREYVETVARREGDAKTLTAYRVRTPKGDLRSVEETVKGISTTYYTEPLLKDKDDVEKILSVPFSFAKPDLKPFFDEREKLGERGVMQVSISTPLVCVSRMLDFTRFFHWCVSERETIARLLRTAQERIAVKLEYLLQKGVGPCFWFGGSEQATPPLMSNRFFDELVVAYDRPLFELVHRYGGLVHVHCHGRVNTVLERFVQMGADMLDPVEPPPSGDIDIADAKRRARGRITLMGNIEFRDLEFATPKEIDEKVRHAICDGGKKHFMLHPSAAAISRLSDRFRDNAIQYVKSGLAYGAFQG